MSSSVRGLFRGVPATDTDTSGMYTNTTVSSDGLYQDDGYYTDEYGNVIRRYNPSPSTASPWTTSPTFPPYFTPLEIDIVKSPPSYTTGLCPTQIWMLADKRGINYYLTYQELADDRISTDDGCAIECLDTYMGSQTYRKVLGETLKRKRDL